MFDLDSSGRISAQELKTVLGQLTLGLESTRGGFAINLNSTLISSSFIQSDSASSSKGSGMIDDGIWQKMIQEADIDGDGEISLDEFEKLMTTLLYNH